LSNIFVVSLYVTGISHEGLDSWLCAYPLIQAACLFGALIPIHLSGDDTPASSRGGFFSWLLASDDPIKAFSRGIHFLCICTSLVGLGLLLNEPDNISRTLTSATCFLIFVHSKHLFLVVALLTRALLLVGPFFATIGVLAVLFGKICQDLYGPDIDTNQRFQDLKEIVLTTFQLFTGCSWHAIMWEISSRTHLGSTALFCSYQFVSSLLFGQLILGVIISISEEILGFKSIRINKLVTPYLKDLEEHQRDAFLRAFYGIGLQLAHIHEEIYQLKQTGRAPIYITSEPTTCQYVVSMCVSKESDGASDELDIRSCDLSPTKIPGGGSACRALGF